MNTTHALRCRCIIFMFVHFRRYNTVFYVALAGKTYTCCDQHQLATFKSNMALPQMNLRRCPSCFNNFVNLYCQFTCNPTHSRYLIADDTQPSGAIHSVTYVVSHDYAYGLYNSCKGRCDARALCLGIEKVVQRIHFKTLFYGTCDQCTVFWSANYMYMYMHSSAISNQAETWVKFAYYWASYFFAYNHFISKKLDADIHVFILHQMWCHQALIRKPSVYCAAQMRRNVRQRSGSTI